MQISELAYDLPPEAIAVARAVPRDHSRLMVVHRGGGVAGGVEHRRFFEIQKYLRAGDRLVVNDTRVLPAKLVLHRKSGAVITGLFLRELVVGQWEVMLRTRGKVKVHEELLGQAGEACYRFLLDERLGEGNWRVRVFPEGPAAGILAAIGAVPLPPYIEKRRQAIDTPGVTRASDVQAYQTVYARPVGKSVAAPTAGLHFTPELLGRLEEGGVDRSTVELEVGPGTFLPVETETLEEHPMHVERFHVPAATVQAVRETRANGGRLVVVGTTAVRTLESAAAGLFSEAAPGDVEGETDLKIAPGFAFRATDVLVTNFHLPRSTLMALVAAFLGGGEQEAIARLKGLYAMAIAEGYRFYSYGDAMLILP